MTIPPIAAEPIAHLGSFTITNSLITAWVAVGLFVLLAFFVNRKLTSGAPGRFQSAMESLLEFMLGYVDQVTGDRAKSRKFFPLVGTLFLFILACNWMGSIPGFGSITRTVLLDGHLENAPVFRPANADLNLTLAMALLTVVTSHLVGMITVGFFAHWNKFFALGTIVKGFKKGGIDIMVGLVEAAVGLIEFVSEIAKVVSLSLRLFGNIFGEDLIILIIGSIVPFIFPLPFMALALITGGLQAFIFVLLSTIYLQAAVAVEHEQDEHGHDAPDGRQAPAAA